MMKTLDDKDPGGIRPRPNPKISALLWISAGPKGDAPHGAPNGGRRPRTQRRRGLPVRSYACRAALCPVGPRDAAISRRACAQSKAGPGSVLRPGETSLWPTRRSGDNTG
jgi:hypothetical protein